MLHAATHLFGVVVPAVGQLDDLRLCTVTPWLNPDRRQATELDTLLPHACGPRELLDQCAVGHYQMEHAPRRVFIFSHKFELRSRCSFLYLGCGLGVPVLDFIVELVIVYEVDPV